MNQNNVKALLKYEIVVVNNIKYLQIPLEEILTENVNIQFKENLEFNESTTTTIEPFWIPDETTTPKLPEIFIPNELQVLYCDNTVLTEDVVKYLELAAQCWELHNVEFKKSILKKIAGFKPALNTAAFKIYGKDSDDILTKLVTNNIKFIQNCWQNDNKN